MSTVTVFSDCNLISSWQGVSEADCVWAQVTLEMPFKDTDNVPDPAVGWSPPRCEKMGAAMLDALEHVLPFLRDPSPPAKL